jgi:hypothetical protein
VCGPRVWRERTEIIRRSRGSCRRGTSVPDSGGDRCGAVRGVGGRCGASEGAGVEHGVWMGGGQLMVSLIKLRSTLTMHKAHPTTY